MPFKKQKQINLKKFNIKSRDANLKKKFVILKFAKP